MQVTTTSGREITRRSFVTASRLLLVSVTSLCVTSGLVPAAGDSTRRLGFEDSSIVDNAAEIWDNEGAAWPRWTAHDEANEFTVDHSWWDSFMTNHSERQGDQGVLDYVYVANRGLGDLAGYIYAMEQVPVSTLSRNEQLAYWLNLHNAYAIQATAQSLTSIAEMADTTRHIVLGKQWREKALEVEGVQLSLVDIERRIVMRQWNDPRVLYGIYLPALGAPSLPIKPFTGGNVWAMLNDRAKAFVNSDRAMEFHGDKLHVSALYFWDRWLFPTDAAVLDHLRAFADPELKSRLAKINVVTATYLNWRLVSYNSGYDRHQDRQGGS